MPQFIENFANHTSFMQFLQYCYYLWAAIMLAAVVANLKQPRTAGKWLLAAVVVVAIGRFVLPVVFR